MNVVTKTITMSDGRTITIETGKLAKQADGSVMVRMGNTLADSYTITNERGKCSMIKLDRSLVTLPIFLK